MGQVLVLVVTTVRFDCSPQLAKSPYVHSPYMPPSAGGWAGQAGCLHVQKSLIFCRATFPFCEVLKPAFLVFFCAGFFTPALVLLSAISSTAAGEVGVREPCACEVCTSGVGAGVSGGEDASTGEVKLGEAVAGEVGVGDMLGAAQG